ncbi:MAG TPA: MarR family transcriptional regulator [Gaiellaceae bacterium]|nr:MarR family transcriptional regulator [Gaiellaceae bacterium]
MPPSPSSRAADAVIATAPLATRWIQRLLQRHDPPLSLGQLAALRAIAAERLAAAELARRTGVSGSAVSQLVAELEHAGLVRRGTAAGDRRRQELALTPDGKRVLASASAVLRRGVGDLLADLPPPEADALARGLATVESLLAGTPPPRRPPPPGPKHRRPPVR